jgi:hypothetical protein
MSQPVALIARISLSKESFTRFLRSKAAKSLANCIDATLDCNISNYYIFRYLKPRESVFAFIYFNYGNANSLKESLELEILQALAAFAKNGESGYILTHLDALNLNADNVVDSWMVVDQQCVRTKQLPSSVWSELTQDAAKYFYKETKKDFAQNFTNKRIVNKSIVKRCQAIAENRRIQKLSTLLHLASFLQPLYLFGDYFYNGEYAYCTCGRIAPLREIDIASFKPMPFGAVDAKHAVIGGWVLEVDVASFKMLQKGEVTFYKDAHRVFNENLKVIHKADAASFRLVNDFYAEDRSYVYCCGEIISKADLGVFKCYPAGYFHAQKLLIGERGIYQGATRLGLDPVSFQVISTHKLSRGVAFDIAYFVRDKNGGYLLTSKHDSLSTPIQIQTEDPNDAVAQVHEANRTSKARANEEFPPTENTGTDTLDRFREWADKNLHRLYQQYRYHNALGGYFQSGSSFYQAVNNYLFLLFQAGDHEEMLRTYDLVRDTAWLHPYIFHHLACCYAALGQADKAVAEVQKALDFGYEHMEKIWSDSDLALIHDDPRFQYLRNTYGDDHFRMAPIDLILNLAALPDDVGQKITEELLIKQSNRFYLPRVRTVRDWLSDTDAVKQRQFTRYADALQFIYDKRLLLTDFSSSQQHQFYQQYKDHEDLSVLVHLHSAEYCFRHMHYCDSIDAKYLGYFQEALEGARRALARERAADSNSLLSEELENNDFLTYVVAHLTGEYKIT